MRRICKMAVLSLTFAALLFVAANSATAQGIIVTQPPVYYTPPVVSNYYVPAPTVTYYPPAPRVSYYYAPPVVTYSTPAPAYYPPTTVTTYRNGVIFPRRTVVTQYNTPGYYYP